MLSKQSGSKHLFCTLLEVFQEHPTGRRPWGRLRTHCWDYIPPLARERLGIFVVASIKDDSCLKVDNIYWKLPVFCPVLF